MDTPRKIVPSLCGRVGDLSIPALLLVLFLASVVPAQHDDWPSEFHLSTERTAAVVAVQWAAACDPMTAVAIRVASFDLDVWQEWPPLLDRVPRLSPGRLSSVRDDTWFAGGENAFPEDLSNEAREEAALYWQAVFYASKIPSKVFAEAAAKEHYLTFGHLYGEPAKYRGRVVHFEGRLVRLKRLDPPLHARLRGLQALFEAWIYLDQPGTHPICAILAHQPEGVDFGDDLNRRVALDGYFFKRYRYISGRVDKAGENVRLSTVLIIAPTLLAGAISPVRGPTPFAPALWPWFAGFGVVSVSLLIAMIWWLRRSDRRVEARLRQIRAAAITDQPSQGGALPP
jgi:hypothetical protein